MPLFLAEATEPTYAEWAVWAIIASPLIAFGLITASLRPFPKAAGSLALIGVGTSVVFSFGALLSAIDADGGVAIHSHEWFAVGELVVNLGVRLDGLAAVMVQLFSFGYMAGDPGRARYFGYMCLFTMSMLGLVLADNLFMVFIFWELVGLCSYLLIGFWFHKPSAAAAAKKAFIVTRVGDLGLLAALLLIWTRGDGGFGVQHIEELVHSGALAGSTLTLFALGLFAGAAGKSAQFPLYVWLPDAMEGPTPVSALIHAATMVAAGVYLMARFFFVLEASHDAALTVAWVGGVTALMAATIAMVQTDLKRVLAYSTISQLGYMMLALGVFGYVAAVFHLFTHAFFKALLFLGSGSVNHSTNTFDMRRMGGLRHAMPITFWTFLIGSLSLAGIFPLAGFWSKDEILSHAWDEERALWWIGAGVAFLTAFYMFRAIFMTFFGSYRGGEPVDHEDEDSHFHGDPAQPHESAWVMTFPLALLVVPAVLAGWFNAAGITHEFGDLINGALAEAHEAEAEFDWWIASSSTVVALAGIGIAYIIYQLRWISSEAVRTAFLPLSGMFQKKYFLDIIYEDIFVKTFFQRGWNRLLELNDRYVIDGVINGSGRLARTVSDHLQVIQTGQLQAYRAILVAGVIVIVAAVYAANPL